MLQASTMLNKASAAALSYPPTEVRSMIDDVKQELSEADALPCLKFMALPLMSAHDKALQSQTEKTFTAWHGNVGASDRLA